MVHVRQDLSMDWDAVRRITATPAREIDQTIEEADNLFKDGFEKYIYGIIKHIDPRPRTIVITGNCTIYPFGAKIYNLEDPPDVPLNMVDVPWDIFIHNSDHGVENQTYEMELAWGLLRPEGLLIVNAYTWAEHGAFEQFLIRKKRRFWACGGAAIVIKPAGAKVYKNEWARTLAKTIAACTEEM